MNDSLTGAGAPHDEPPPASTTARPLGPDELYRRCAVESLTFSTTAELERLRLPLGQARAAEAARLALTMPHVGYNLMVVGPSGVGKHAFIEGLLAELAPNRETPCDVCYVHDFAKGNQPRALKLPSGRGRSLERDLAKLVEDLRAAIPAAFEGDDYRTRLRAIEEEFQRRSERVFERLGKVAAERGVALLRLPNGFAFAPLMHGEVVGPDEFAKLGEAERERFKEASEALQQELQHALRELPDWAREARQKVRELSREVTRYAVRRALAEVENEYRDLPQVTSYLELVFNDVLEHADDFKREREEGVPSWLAEIDDARRLDRYKLNVLVDHSTTRGAPVVYEDRPTCDRLLGRIEQRAQLGNLVSDFTLIKPGALHLANGGYLVLDARRLLGFPNAWESLKRALAAREIRIESLAQLLGISNVTSLEPEPVALDLKVVLIADRALFHLLGELDPDVADLFKVVADFEEDLERDADGERDYARLCATIAERAGLRAFDRAAVARLLEHSSRLSGDSRKLSLNTRLLADLLREADHCAAERAAELAGVEDVEAALAAQIRRLDRLKQRFHEQILNKNLLIDTGGERVGQVNALSVIDFGGHAFAAPTRISATARIGEGKVIDIEREVELGGPLHSKGVLILSSYLASRYTREFPLSLSASLVFEQSYVGVEGDSASLAELCALLAALAGLGIKQGLAVTGSVNQYGVVQTIGAVNEKIEGFFDICAARGLTGEQGVIIPSSNVPHLMLKKEVVDAVRQGLFHVDAVSMADEAIERLTGVRAGQANDEGEYPEGTVNQLVLAQLLEFAVVGQSFEKFVRINGTGPEQPEPPGPVPPVVARALRRWAQ